MRVSIVRDTYSGAQGITFVHKLHEILDIIHSHHAQIVDRLITHLLQPPPDNTRRFLRHRQRSLYHSDEPQPGASKNAADLPRPRSLRYNRCVSRLVSYNILLFR